MKTDRIVYWISTTVMSLVFLAGALMYLVNYERALGYFVGLGFPTWIIYPLGALKVLGVIAIWTRYSSFLKELAYAGFLYDVTLALAGHVMVRDGEYAPAIVALMATIISWIFDRRVFGPYRQGA